MVDYESTHPQVHTTNGIGEYPMPRTISACSAGLTDCFCKEDPTGPIRGGLNDTNESTLAVA